MSSASILACRATRRVSLGNGKSGYFGSHRKNLLIQRLAPRGWVEQLHGIYVGPTVDAAAQRHGIDFQVATHDGDTKPQGFKPLPLRWRVEATFGTLSNRYRRLTKNWEESPKNSEDAVELANCHRLIRNYGRDVLGQT